MEAQRERRAVQERGRGDAADESSFEDVERGRGDHNSDGLLSRFDAVAGRVVRVVAEGELAGEELVEVAMY